jgi:Amidohydrolase family
MELSRQTVCARLILSRRYAFGRVTAQRHYKKARLVRALPARTVDGAKMKTLIHLLLFGASAWAQDQPTADLMVTDANIYTVDRQHPQAEAVAVIGDRIVALGSKAEIDRLRGPETRVIDAHGKLLLPGFNDAHVHFIHGGAGLYRRPSQSRKLNAPP